MFSYSGRILHVDMTTRQTKVQEVSAEFLKKYLGGVGLASRLLYDNTPKGCDPWGPITPSALRSAPLGSTTMPVGASTAWPPSRP